MTESFLKVHGTCFLITVPCQLKGAGEVARRGRDVKESLEFWLTMAWFTLTYAGLAIGKLPGLRIDRTGIALVGAALVLATGG